MFASPCDKECFLQSIKSGEIPTTSKEHLRVLVARIHYFDKTYTCKAYDFVVTIVFSTVLYQCSRSNGTGKLFLIDTFSLTNQIVFDTNLFPFWFSTGRAIIWLWLRLYTKLKHCFAWFAHHLVSIPNFIARYVQCNLRWIQDGKHIAEHAEPWFSSQVLSSSVWFHVVFTAKKNM